MGGCVLLFFSLGWDPTIKFFCIWAVLGLAAYFLFARSRSHLAPGNEALLHGDGEKLSADPLVHQGPDPGP